MLSMIEKEIEKDLNEENLEELPEEAYQKSKTSTDLGTIKNGRVVIIITKQGDEKGDKTTEIAAERNQQIAKILEQGVLEPGQLVGAKTVSVMMEEHGEFMETEEKFTYIITTEGAENETDRNNLRRNLKKVLEISSRNDCKEIACVASKEIDKKGIRKYLEYVGRKQEVGTVLYEEHNQGWKGIRKRQDEEVIILKPTGQITLAQLIKNMKEKVDTEGIVIDKINKIHNGNIQVKIKGKEEKSRVLFREAMTKELSGEAEVHTKQRTQTFMILDIDETVSEEEVKEVLVKETSAREVEEMQIKLSEKINDRGLKYAFITIRENAAKKMEKKTRIGKGWNRWRIRKVEEAKKCYKCHKVGHISRDCREKEEEARCYKCGETGHVKKDCKGVQKCYRCKEEGHKADSMRCPEYRREQQKERKKENRREEESS